MPKTERPQPTSASRLSVAPEQAAEMLSCSRQHIYRLIDRGELVTFHIGRRRRITYASLEDFVARQVEAEGREAG